jgi:hypothetical protein
MATLFDLLSRGRPAPVEKPKHNDDHTKAELLLGWVNRWPKSVLTLSDVRNFSPRAVRDKETALRSAKILTAHGHLTPLAPHKWEIIRDPLTPTR